MSYLLLLCKCRDKLPRQHACPKFLRHLMSQFWICILSEHTILYYYVPIDCLLCNGARPSCAGVGASMNGPLLGPMSLLWPSSNVYDLFDGKSPFPWLLWGVCGVWGVDGCLCISFIAGRALFIVPFLSSVFILLTVIDKR